MEDTFLIFRADGNANTGLGHLYRIFALIEMYKSNFKFQLVIKDSSVLSVIPKDYNVKVISSIIKVSEEAEWFAENYNSKNSILITDGYQFNSGFQKDVKEKGFKLVFIDDLASEHMYADLVINHSPHISKEDFKSEQYTQFALGTKHAILRPLFLEAAKKSNVIQSLDTALVCFGGVDFNDIAFKAVQALLHSKVFKNINVVLGAAYNHNTIYKLAQENKGVRVYKSLNEKEMFSVMNACQFAIVPSSTILYEVCAIKMPVLGGYFVDNQTEVYNAFLKNEMIYGGGDFNEISITEIVALVRAIVHGDYKKCIKAQQRMFDSKIKQRFLGLLDRFKDSPLGEHDRATLMLNSYL